VGALLAAGLGVALAAPRRARTALTPGAGPGVALVAFATLFPLAWVMAIDANLYDGLRQLLFVVPPLCVLAGLAWRVVADALARGPAALRSAALAAVALWLVYHVSLMVRLHPYQTVYFNRSVGGLAGAYGRYETDYWGNSYREAALALQEVLDAQEPPGRPWRVMLCIRVRATRPLLAGYYLEGVEMTKRPGEADFFIATTRWDCHESREGRELYRVERLGVPLAVVKDVRGAAPAPDAPSPDTP
jgi:hypothetical protein